MTGTPTRMAAWLESAWLARYLERQLDDEELAWFEAYVMDKPELLQGIETDNAMRDALGSDAQWRTSTTPATTSPTKSATPRKFGLVAAIVAALGVGWLAAGLRGPTGLPASIANPTTVVFDTMRGSESPPVVAGASSDAPYLLVEVAIPPSAKSIRLQIGENDFTTLTRADDGFVSFLVLRSTARTRPKIEVRYEIEGKLVKRPLNLQPILDSKP